MPRFRRGRYSRRSGRSLGSVIQSYKKVINHAPASITAGTSTNYATSLGTDSVAAGQTSAIDTAVPTGAVIKAIEFQYAIQNLVNVAAFAWLVIQRTDNGQTRIAPDVVGGNPQRNQVLHQELFSVGQNQNVNRKILLKIPSKFQRVKEGSQWTMSVKCDQVHTAAAQIIYKFYR